MHSYTSYYTHYDTIIIADILRNQREGKPITLAEKKAIQKYAEQQRLKNLSQRKKKVKK